MSTPSASGVTVAVVLAAGAGSRFEGTDHKLRTPFRGRPLVTWAVDAARDAMLDHTLVVTGGADLDDLIPAGVDTVANPRWSDGMATSVHAALEHVRATWPRVDAVVVGLGDQPGIPATAWRAVAAATSTPIAVATYDGARRNPVRLHRSVWDLLPVDGDTGAKVVMKAHPELVTEIPCVGSGQDVDTVADLDGWG